MVPTEAVLASLPEKLPELEAFEKLGDRWDRLCLALFLGLAPLDQVGPLAGRLRTAIGKTQSGRMRWTPADVGRLLKGRPQAQPVYSPVAKLLQWVSSHRIDVEELLGRTPEELRGPLCEEASVKPALVDRLLLLAWQDACLPLEPPVLRVLVRHGWLDLGDDYASLAAAIRSQLPEEYQQLLRLYFGLRWVAHHFCRVRQPQCSSCPLQPLLPETGPYELAAWD
jgi:hypothetical protein